MPQSHKVLCEQSGGYIKIIRVTQPVRPYYGQALENGWPAGRSIDSWLVRLLGQAAGQLNWAYEWKTTWMTYWRTIKLNIGTCAHHNQCHNHRQHNHHHRYYQTVTASWPPFSRCSFVYSLFLSFLVAAVTLWFFFLFVLCSPELTMFGFSVDSLSHYLLVYFDILQL